ncbi:fasciclin domain-containing protein, partial [Planctomycetota bacterium]
DVPKSIPDPGETSSSLTVADSLNITDLNVELDISHSKNNADLNVYLIGPDGTQVELFTDVGVWDKGFKNTILDDEAGTSIKNGSGSFMGIRKYLFFYGKLKIKDDWNSGTGTLNSWRLVIESPNIISWTPADDIASQDLYISDNFDDVSNSNDAAYQGNLAADVSGIEIDLDLSQAYFWRIVSLNEDDMLTAIGDIWSFSTYADVTTPGDPVQGVPNDGLMDGDDWGWPGAETPDLAIDDNTGTKFLHFRGDLMPTGIQVTPLDGLSIVTGITLTTANDSPNRDPVTFELSGSNDSIDGPYELIASGDVVDFAGEQEWPRFTMNATPIAFDNDVAYAHYQLMFPTVRDPNGDNSMQIAEVELLGIKINVSNPAPADGAINVVQDMILTWSKGLNSVSSDVYFGTDSSPAFLETTTGTSFDVGKLATSTTYYWQIDETDADGNFYPGNVWSFTTVIGEATEPNPADLATDVPVDAVLKWKAGATAASYDVYFGTTDTPEFIGNQTETSFALDLEYAAMYYWRIDAVEADGTTHAGALWSFMTPSGQATDPDPADGAILEATTVTLGWTAGDGAALHDVYFGTDPNALEYQGSQTGTNLAIGIFGRPFPDGLVPGMTYYWQILEVEADGLTIHESPVWSFMVAPEKAYNPSPADGAELASDAVVVLSWSPGLGAKLHSVYFGDDLDAVTNAKGEPTMPSMTFDPGLLEAGKTYYWRVDEMNPPNTAIGDVWSFSLAAVETDTDTDTEPEPEPVPEPNLLDVAVLLNTEGDLAGTLDTFIAAVLAADLAEGLATDNVTVFVPTDDAFDALGLTAENIARLDIAALTDLLLYHATAGSLLAADVLAVDHMEMLNGGNVNQFAGVLTDNFGNKSQITVTDMEGSNGVIHMINAVMLPNVLPELGPEPEPEPEPVV